MPDVPEGFKWEIERPPDEVGWGLPRYKRLVGPWVPLQPNEYERVDGDGHTFRLKETTDA